MSLTFDDRFTPDTSGIPEGLRRIMSVPVTLPHVTTTPPVMVPTAPPVAAPRTSATESTAPVVAPAATPAAVPAAAPAATPDPLHDPEWFEKGIPFSGHQQSPFATTHPNFPHMPPWMRPGREHHRGRHERGRGRVPDFARMFGIHNPEEALRFFGQFASNPAFARHLPPFMRGANSPFFSLLSSLARGNNLSPDDFKRFISGMVPGSETGGGATPGPDVPAAETPASETGLTELPMAPGAARAGSAPSVPAESTPGNTPATPSAPDGSPTDVPGAGFTPGVPNTEAPDFPYTTTPGGQFTPVIGPLAPGDPRLVQPQTFPGMNEPVQGWTTEPIGTTSGRGRRGAGALPTIERKDSESRPTSGISPRLTEFVKKREGFRAHAFGDYHQNSIGYGTKATSRYETITRDEAEKRLNEELTKSQSAVDRILPPGAPQNVRDALTSFTYNVGPGWTRRSTLAQAVHVGNWPLAAQLMQHYNRAGGRINAGLVHRRRLESAWLLS